jgi:5-methylcytosine-specific restriction enzyme A
MTKSIYWTKRWRDLRQAKLEAEPFCEICARRGMRVPATAVDHKVSIASGGDPYPPLNDLASMCASCHNTKTAARDNPYAFGDGSSLAFKGCNADGLPIDGDHPFWSGRDTPPPKARPRPTQPSSQDKRYLVPKIFDI